MNSHLVILLMVVFSVSLQAAELANEKITNKKNQIAEAPKDEVQNSETRNTEAQNAEREKAKQELKLPVTNMACNQTNPDF